MQVSVENVFYFLHPNLVAVQQHPQNLIEEYRHLKINYLTEEIYLFVEIPCASSGGGLSLLSFEAIYLKKVKSIIMMMFSVTLAVLFSFIWKKRIENCHTCIQKQIN
jgi:hypothetical protein